MQLNAVCQSEEELELHAMGRLQDAFLQEHFDSCPICRKRVRELRQEIALLKMALARWRPSISAPRKCGHRH